MRENTELTSEIAYYFKCIMDLLQVPTNESTVDTPTRVAKMYANEIFSSLKRGSIEELNNKMKVFPNTTGSEEIVIVKNIEFHSMCEHHFMPFFGKIDIGYKPIENIIGLSKIPRVVKYFSCKPQLQERLGQEIGDYLSNLLDTTVWVRIKDTTHTCVSMRGIEACCDTDTLYVSQCGKAYKCVSSRPFLERC